jgi:predicted ATPase
VVQLEPLMVPELDQADHKVLARIPAVELFVERARAADPSFALNAGNATAVATLCRQLEGLPLALELAAARVRVAGVNGLLEALVRGVDALGQGSRDMPDRQRGLRAALDWTVSLLEDQQRELFMGLGVFADAWTIEQAERVIGGELELWEPMAALIDYSLIRTRGDGRLTMAERVRTHARALLGASGREHELRARHAELMAETAEQLSLDLLLDLGATIARTRDALEELEQALSWSAAADPVLHRRLVSAAGRPLFFVSRLPVHADEIVQLSADENGSDLISGRLMLSRATVESLNGNIAEVVH